VTDIRDPATADDPATEDDLSPDLAHRPLPPDVVGLLEGMATTRAIRRYREEPVPPEILRAILFAASRAPSGSNRQPFRFIVLRDGPRARRAKQLIGEAARQAWVGKRSNDGYEEGSGSRPDSPKARMARTMEAYVEHFETVPVVVLPCLVRYRRANMMEGASVYPACQNILLAARALGYGGALTGWPPSPSASLPDRTVPPAGGHWRSWSSRMAGRNRRRGRSTLPAPGSPQPVPRSPLPPCRSSGRNGRGGARAAYHPRRPGVWGPRR
jgi:nitroreductase